MMLLMRGGELSDPMFIFAISKIIQALTYSQGTNPALASSEHSDVNAIEIFDRKPLPSLILQAVYPPSIV